MLRNRQHGHQRSSLISMGYHSPFAETDSLAINVTFCPFQTLRQELVNLKDPVPEGKRKEVIYSIHCNECQQSYIGQTGRSLDHRLGEHRRALRNEGVLSSSLAEHVFVSHHQMDLSKVIDAHPHTQTHWLLESCHIQHEQAPLNRGRGSMPGIYATLLDWYHT